MARMARLLQPRSLTQTPCFLQRQAAIQGQDEYDKWPADGQRRSNARKLQQRHADTRLRRISVFVRAKGRARTPVRAAACPDASGPALPTRECLVGRVTA